MRGAWGGPLLGALLAGACAGGSSAPVAAPATTPPAPASVPLAAEPAGAVAVVVPPTAVRASYSIMSGSLGPYWVAQAAGLWQEHGLDVDLSLISGAPTSMAALMAGDTAFAIASGDSVLGVQAQNPDVVAILNTSVGSTHRLMVASDIRQPADLKGRRVGVNSIGDGSYTLLSKAFPRIGIDPQHDVIWTAMGGGNAASYVMGLSVGSLDAAPLTPPNDLAAERQGAHALLALADLDLATAGLPAFTMRRTITQRRPVVEAFAAGVVDGVRRFKADPVFAREVLAQRTGSDDPELLDWTYQVYSGKNSTDRPFIDGAKLQGVIADLAVAQPELHQVEAARTFDNSVLDDLERQGYFTK